jgi:hypothetical protein
MISLNIRRWKLGQLVGASAAYWAVLAAAALSPYSRAVYAIGKLGGNRGTATAAINDGVVTLTALKDGIAVYTGSATTMQIALWIALPPLGLWLAWLASRPSRARAEEELRAERAREALPDAARNGLGDRAASSPHGVPLDRGERRS